MFGQGVCRHIQGKPATSEPGGVAHCGDHLEETPFFLSYHLSTSPVSRARRSSSFRYAAPPPKPRIHSVEGRRAASVADFIRPRKALDSSRVRAEMSKDIWMDAAPPQAWAGVADDLRRRDAASPRARAEMAADMFSPSQAGHRPGQRGRSSVGWGPAAQTSCEVGRTVFAVAGRASGHRPGQRWQNGLGEGSFGSRGSESCGLGAADGSVQLPHLDDSLSALLAKEEAAALAAARLGKLRVPPPPPPPPPPPFHSLHLSLSSVHEADVEDESLAAKLAQLAPRLRSPTDGDSAVSADGSAVRKWLRAWLADVLTTRIVLVFIALQLAAGVIVWSRRRRCGRSSSAREPPLPLSQACDPGGSGDDSEVDETFDETEDGAARESRQSTESGFIGQRCSLHCSSRDSGGMRHALILHGHARAGADSEWDDGHEETGVLSACGAPQRNARSQDMD